MWALYDAPLASGCQFQWHWAWRVGRLRCLHKMSFSSPRSRTYSRLQSSSKLAKKKLGVPATFRKNHSWARPTKQQIWILELYVSKILGTFVTWAVRVKEQQKLWILCWFVCLAMQKGGYFRNWLTGLCQTRDRKQIGWCDSLDAPERGLRLCAASSLISAAPIATMAACTFARCRPSEEFYFLRGKWVLTSQAGQILLLSISEHLWTVGGK